MINILIVTHGNFGMELLKSAEMIIGKVDNVKTISFLPNESFETLAIEVEEAVKKFAEEDLIVFTDMYGGSPCNAVSRLMRNYNFYHITGVNFPLFLDIAVSRSSYNMEELDEKIIKNGKKSIVFLNDKIMLD